MAAPHVVVEFTTKVAIARCQFAGFRRRELRPQQLVFQLLNSVSLVNSVTLACARRPQPRPEAKTPSRDPKLRRFAPKFRERGR